LARHTSCSLLLDGRATTRFADQKGPDMKNLHTHRTAAGSIAALLASLATGTTALAFDPSLMARPPVVDRPAIATAATTRPPAIGRPPGSVINLPPASNPVPGRPPAIGTPPGNVIVPPTPPARPPIAGKPTRNLGARLPGWWDEWQAVPLVSSRSLHLLRAGVAATSSEVLFFDAPADEPAVSMGRFNVRQKTWLGWESLPKVPIHQLAYDAVAAATFRGRIFAFVHDVNGMLLTTSRPQSGGSWDAWDVVSPVPTATRYRLAATATDDDLFLGAAADDGRIYVGAISRNGSFTGWRPLDRMFPIGNSPLAIAALEGGIELTFEASDRQTYRCVASNYTGQISLFSQGFTCLPELVGDSPWVATTSRKTGTSLIRAKAARAYRDGWRPFVAMEQNGGQGWFELTTRGGDEFDFLTPIFVGRDLVVVGTSHDRSFVIANRNGVLPGSDEVGVISLPGWKPDAMPGPISGQPTNTPSPRCTDASFSTALRPADVAPEFEGWLPWLVTFGDLIPDGTLARITNAGWVNVRLVKPGSTTDDCSDPDAIVMLPPGGTVSAAEVFDATPSLPVSVVACVDGGVSPPAQVALTMAYTFCR
jgi:hypothetical protein